MTPEQIEIMNLRALLAKCLGAFEVIEISPDDFNKEGVSKMIQDIREVLNDSP